MESKKTLVFPDYKNCIANLPNSVLKKFGVDTVGDTLPLLDKYLEKDYKNIVVILLDGMGKAILEHHLKENGPFRSHLAGIYTSVFLSTTVLFQSPFLRFIILINENLQYSICLLSHSGMPIVSPS